MRKLIIAGVETVLGANLAAWLSDRFEVVGLSLGEDVRVNGCETGICPREESHTIQAWVASEQPDWLIYCGPASESEWQHELRIADRLKAAGLAQPWILGAAVAECPLTVISSSSIFTGPWMFHNEDSQDFCNSTAARGIVAMENLVRDLYPEAMIIRTHAFGWSPQSEPSGLVEETLHDLYSQHQIKLDALRHGSPILATDLAEILLQAYQAGLRGTYHIGGAERVSAYQFGALLASQFACAYHAPEITETQVQRSTSFGAGESALSCAKIRRELGISLPMLTDGLERLHLQTVNGFRDQFGVHEEQGAELLAG